MKMKSANLIPAPRRESDAAVQADFEPVDLGLPTEGVIGAAQGLVESVPKLAAVSAARSVGVPAPLAAGGVDSHFHGQIQDFRIYSRVLTGTEINTVYTKTKQ